MSSKPVPQGTIVVGVDGSPTSDLALGWAVEEASRRRLPLHIIHAFSYGYPMTDIGIGYAINGLRQLADGVRKDAVALARRANPQLVITWSEPAYRPAPAPRGRVGDGGHGGTGAPGHERRPWRLHGVGLGAGGCTRPLSRRHRP